MLKTMEAYQPLDAVTFKQAALEILKATGMPMHYTEITKVAIETGYWRAQDEDFIRQHMYQAIKSDIRKKRYGSVFEEVAPGTYQVNKLMVKD
ncbi:MAG TPA: winged helix-turn-helix domain-containing protein [Lacibacter sp.]|nr:winged helix-turn-helix domain-containing protein [Lacibacter sp.]HMO87657.1 winged helix-turn-helix domain-containing protein [Lacibacter sp.]HMP86947.1 winged helix-turn-helix domain-containing protein [Lacibacter sp.]